jgi:hypothetical protein
LNYDINTSSIKFGSRLILSRAPLIAAAPNFGAVTVDNPHKTYRCSNGRYDNNSFVHNDNVGLSSKFKLF